MLYLRLLSKIQINSNPELLELLKQIQQGQTRQNSELISRLEALTKALTANIDPQHRNPQSESGSKRKIARSHDESNNDEHLGPKRKIATSNDESNSQGNSSNYPDVTRAHAECDRQSEDEAMVNADNISIPDQDTVDRDIEALLGPGETADNPEDSGPSDSLLEDIAADLFMAEDDKGEDINRQLAKIVNGLWSNRLAEDKLKEKLKKYPTPANCNNVIVPKCNHEIWTNSLTSSHRFNDLSLQKTQCQVSKAANAIIQVCDELLAHKTNGGNALNTNKLIGYTTDALALLGNARQEISQRRREAIKVKIPHRLHHLASNVPANSTLLFGDDINKRIQAISTANRALANRATSSYKRSDPPSFISKGQSWQHSKNRSYPQRGSASGTRGLRQSRRGRGFRS